MITTFQNTVITLANSRYFSLYISQVVLSNATLSKKPVLPFIKLE